MHQKSLKKTISFALTNAGHDINHWLQVKTVEETLKYLFKSLQSIIPDVLEACSNDGTMAFERLQQMQASLFCLVQRPGCSLVDVVQLLSGPIDGFQKVPQKTFMYISFPFVHPQNHHFDTF